MSFLTDRTETDVITFEGYEIRIDTSYDTILRVYELQEETIFDDAEKLGITYEMLVPNHEQYPFDTYKQIAEVVRLAFDLLSGGKSGSDGESFIDFDHDAERIYASFLRDYDIDLQKEQGRMSWSKFIALINTLSDDAPLMKAVGYRAMKIPTEKEVGKKERDRLMKLKKAYELPSQKAKREKEVLAYMEKRLKSHEKG